MSWHVEPGTLERYARGEVGDTLVFSIEGHLIACEACRGALTVDTARLERMWSGVAVAVDAPRRRLGERVLIRLGTPEHVARLLAATPSLRVSWAVAVAMSLLFVVLAGRLVAESTLPFLITAPLVPVAGVALAFARPLDDAFDVLLATPLGGLRLVLIRTAAVLAVSLAICGLVALALPDARGWEVVAWLIPSLALVSATLAASTIGSTETVATVVGVLWVAAVLAAGWVTSDPHAAFGRGGQLAWGAVLLAATAAAVVRRNAFETGVRV